MLLSLSLLAPAWAAPVKIANVEAKSYYSERGSTYYADNVKDGKSASPWFEGDPGNGVGAWIEVDLGGTHTVTKIQMLAGDWSSGGDWQRANRPAEVEIKWSDDTTEIWNLDDEWTIQTFTPSPKKATSKIRFKINSLHNGTAFPDTAISEILVFDDQQGTTVEVASVAASSEFPSDNEGAYYAFQAADGVKDTMWCEGNKGGDGVGEWVELTLRGSAPVKGLEICAGMCASMGIHKKGNAPLKATAIFSDGSTERLTFKDFPLPQKIMFGGPHTTSSIKVQIDEIRKGSEFDDACFSEIKVLR